MEQNVTLKSDGLENELRRMIISNVASTNGQADQATEPTRHYQSRDRGRGSGRGRLPYQLYRHPNSVNRGQGQEAYKTTSATFIHPHQNGGVSSAGAQQDRHLDRKVRGSYHQQTVVDGQNAFPERSQHSKSSSLHDISGAKSNVIPRPRVSDRAFYQHPPCIKSPTEISRIQDSHLDTLVAREVPKVEMPAVELEEREAFRQNLELVLQQAFEASTLGKTATISLVGFGSLASGFGLSGSDMDLAIVPRWKCPSKTDKVGIDRISARLLERAVLDNKMGGRLLTRTRVPILKVCQKPTDALYTALLQERKKWEELPEDEKFPTNIPSDPARKVKPSTGNDTVEALEISKLAVASDAGKDLPELSTKTSSTVIPGAIREAGPRPSSTTSNIGSKTTKGDSTSDKPYKEQHDRSEKPWMREKVIGPLDFPQTGVGIQCDINFDNPLGIHNTHMLRCYSLTDPRVRPVVLFVKSWAKRRKINSSYSGTLSSYGWVLMVLHYLVNIAQPPVCPNLQHAIPPPTDLAGLEMSYRQHEIGGYNVRYWDNEQEITQAAHAGGLSQNRQTIGGLLRGFFQYFASINTNYYRGPRPPQFFWTTDVLSLRMLGGIQTKQTKGWTSATTKVTAEKTVTNRYLFAIEDPFETDHNVARTVTHHGIVAIRDELRRAWRILKAIGQGLEHEGDIFDEIVADILPSSLPRSEARDEVVKSTGKEGVDDQSMNPPVTPVHQGVADLVLKRK